MSEGFLWIDVETTGLDCGNDHLLEAACIITDMELKEISRWETIFPPRDGIALDEFIVDMHTKSGLLEAIAKTPRRYNMFEEFQVLSLEKMAESGVEILHPAGSSVHFDMDFIRIYFPVLTNVLHHRYFDITSLKLLTQVLTGEYPPPVEIYKPQHRAMPDIMNSLEFARSYLG